MKTAPIKPANDPAVIEEAAAILKSGGLVAMPTETVYGLAADAGNPDAVARLYAVKGRPRFNPLIAHVSGPNMAWRLAGWPDLADQLAEAFWPGPLTLVLPKRPDAAIADIANAGLDSIALRAPRHAAAQALIRAFDAPLVAPSANPSGAISPTSAEHVSDGLGNSIDLILDGGTCPVGLESSVIALLGGAPTLLRPGGLARRQIEAITGRLSEAGSDEALLAPGMMKSHYAPNTAMRLNADRAEPGEVLLGFGAIAGDINLSPDGDLAEAATRLFAALRALDARSSTRIAVAPIPNEGLGEAINDRLQRAAAPKDELT